MFQEGIPPKIDDLAARVLLLEKGLKAFNDALKTVDQHSMKEVDNVNEWVNRRGEEIKEIDNVMKNLLDRFSGLEEHVHLLKEEGLVWEEMIASLQAEVDGLQAEVDSLQAEVDSLQLKICCCNEATSRPLSGSRTWESPFKLEYTDESKYHPPPIVTSLVPIKVEEERDPSWASRFGDDEEEELAIEEAVESLEDEAVPQENEVPLPIQITSPPPAYTPSVYLGQCCKHSRGPLKMISYHPYCHSDTFMGMPTGLWSTKDLHCNLERLRQTGSSHKHNSAHSGLSLSETSYGDITDRSIDLCTERDVGSFVGHPASPEV